MRAGEQVELPTRSVTVHELRVTDLRSGEEHLDVDVSLRCSSGTYVRAVARDLGEDLGVGGHLVALRRTAVGPFGLAEAHTLEELGEAFGLLGIDEVARRCFPSHDLTEEEAGHVRYGRSLTAHLGAAGPVAVFGPGQGFLALYEQRGEQAAPVAVFV